MRKKQTLFSFSKAKLRKLRKKSKKIRVAPHEQEEQEEQFRKKNSGSIPKEKWISLEWDAEKWSSILDEKGMDTKAQRQFFFLAVYGESGKYEANKLLSKMIGAYRPEENHFDVPSC